MQSWTDLNLRVTRTGNTATVGRILAKCAQSPSHAYIRQGCTHLASVHQEGRISEHKPYEKDEKHCYRV